jgi:hypothetical protein
MSGRGGGGNRNRPATEIYTVDISYELAKRSSVTATCVSPGGETKSPDLTIYNNEVALVCPQRHDSMIMSVKVEAPSLNLPAASREEVSNVTENMRGAIISCPIEMDAGISVGPLETGINVARVTCHTRS